MRSARAARPTVTLAILVLVTSCAEPRAPRSPVAVPARAHPDAIAQPGPPPPSPSLGAPEAPALPVPLVESPGPMGPGDAERYVLALVDRDRAAHGLGPLRWDETAARAARRHARDLLAHGVTSHVGTDGSVPEQRYTEAGGRAMVWENVACFADGETRAPAPDPRIYADALAAIERAFLDETPPHDGHRKNLLGARHTGLGAGVAATRGSRYACLVEELVDDYGDYEELPAWAWAGRRVEVAGTLRGGARVLAVGVSRVDLPRPRAAGELRPTRGYPIPPPSAIYQAELRTDAQRTRFSVRVPLGEEGQQGLYGVSVWASFAGASEPALISLRTVAAF